MVSNNTLAVLVLVGLVISFVGIGLIYGSFVAPTAPNVETGKGVVKLNVVPAGTLLPTGAIVKLNVIENKGGK